MLKIDDELRAKPEYQIALQAALDTYPQMNRDIFEMALVTAIANPQGHLQIDSVDDKDQPPVSDAVIGVNDPVTISQDDGDIPSSDLSQVSEGDA